LKQLSTAYNLYRGNIIPAFNLRVLTFNTARALFRVAKKLQISDFIIELAQSEMQYTSQSPKTFAKTILKAAKKENYKEPIYLQGDHYKPKGDLEKLIKKAIKVGFYNIDIDCSAFALNENIAKTNFYAEHIRKLEPKGVTINIGAEIGQIGGNNTTPSDLEAFLSQVNSINKVAVQTGTAHGKGGIIDWALLQELSKIAKNHGLNGVVQHGASTLSESDLRKLANNGVCEVHLATEIMNAVLQNPMFPFKIEKKQIRLFKKKINKMPQATINKIMEAVEDKFVFFFQSLRR